MPSSAQMQDRYGLPLTTSSAQAAESFVEGLDLLLEQNFGPEERFTQAIEADPEFALAHSALAYMLHLRAEAAEAREYAQKAQALAAGISRRERQQVEAIALFVTGQGPRSYALIREHLADYPRDILLLRVAQRLSVLGCSGAGIPSFPAPLFALMQGVASTYGDDWAFLGQYAFAHHETGHIEGRGVWQSAPWCSVRRMRLPPTLLPMCSSRPAMLRMAGRFWRPGSRALTRVRPTTSTSPGIRRCSSWRAAITSGRLPCMRRISGRPWSPTERPP